MISSAAGVPRLARAPGLPLALSSRRYRRKLVLGLLAIVGAVALGLASPLLLGGAIDALRDRVSRDALLGYAGLILGVTLVQGIFSYLQRMILVAMSRDIEFDLRNDYFASLERQPPAFFQRAPDRRPDGARHQRPRRRCA